MRLMHGSALGQLVGYLERMPAVRTPIATGTFDDGRWWVKFAIDISDDLAWHVVQELAHVLNYLSVEERLPTMFMPVSPPPYMNGGPEQFLSWVIESTSPDFSPSTCAEWLEGRLPRPVESRGEWSYSDA
jgi:hypothetical protein